MLRKMAVACGATAFVVGSMTPAVADVVPTVPSPPVGVVVTSWSSNALTAYWQPSENDGGSLVSFYEATLSPGGKTCRVTALTDLMRCDFTGLQPNRAYSATVTSENAIGKSASSIPSEPVMLWGLPKIKSLQPGNRKVRVNWTSTVDSTVTGFVVSDIRGKRTCYAPVEKRSCVVWGLKNGQKYRFQVSLRSGRNVIVTSKPSKVVVPRRGAK